MSEIMGTSQWIGFFRKAGLPANVAANYAIIFSDNRIQLDMLLDLSKEYLYDMGIKVMGDVIAILKYAKEFHNQLVKEKMIGGTSVPPTNSVTVAERVVGRYTRPVAPSSVRLSGVEAERGLQRGKAGVISLKRKVPLPEQVPVRKSRRVPPEEEGAYKIKMPSGTTEKTRKLLQLQQQLALAGQQKRSVFSRLGDSAVSSSTDSKVSSSVFERLGPSTKSIRDDIPSSTVDYERPNITGKPLQYRGVLKMTVGKKRTVMATSPKKVVPTSRTVIKPGAFGNRTIIKTVKLNQINSILQTSRSPMLRTPKPSGTQGIFANRRVGIQASNIRSRLGQKIDARNLARTKILAKTTAPMKKQSNVFSRLGR